MNDDPYANTFDEEIGEPEFNDDEGVGGNGSDQRRGGSGASGSKRGPQVPPLPFRRHGEKEPLDDRAWLVDNLVPEVGTGVLAGQWGTLSSRSNSRSV
jgi:hypothetical protein